VYLALVDVGSSGPGGGQDFIELVSQLDKALVMRRKIMRGDQEMPCSGITQDTSRYFKILTFSLNYSRYFKILTHILTQSQP
jgi:hypothetical protein